MMCVWEDSCLSLCCHHHHCVFFPLVQVKLRRRTKGEVWEVVSMRDADETLSVLASLRQVVMNGDEKINIL